MVTALAIKEFKIWKADAQARVVLAVAAATVCVAVIGLACALICLKAFARDESKA
jgi:hypothetical protein